MKNTERTWPAGGAANQVLTLDMPWEQAAVNHSFRALEVTCPRPGEFHPHFHVLLVVPGAYLEPQSYITQEEWAVMWRKALGAERMLLQRPEGRPRVRARARRVVADFRVGVWGFNQELE